MVKIVLVKQYNLLERLVNGTLRICVYDPMTTTGDIQDSSYALIPTAFRRFGAHPPFMETFIPRKPSFLVMS